jgi:hypothetical protein
MVAIATLIRAARVRFLTTPRIFRSRSTAWQNRAHDSMIEMAALPQWPFKLAANPAAPN